MKGMVTTASGLSPRSMPHHGFEATGLNLNHKVEPQARSEVQCSEALSPFAVQLITSMHALQCDWTVMLAANQMFLLSTGDGATTSPVYGPQQPLPYRGPSFLTTADPVGNGMNQLGEFLAGRCLDPTEPGCSIAIIGIHAIEEQHVKFQLFAVVSSSRIVGKSSSTTASRSRSCPMSPCIAKP